MPQVGWKCVFTGEDKTYAECIACAKTDAHCEFTPEMLISMSRRLQPRPMTQLSVTRVLGETRQRVIEAKFDYRVSPRKNWASFRGTMSHRQLAGAVGDAWYEVYQTRVLEINGAEYEICGTVDKIHGKQGLIVDYKSTKRCPAKGAQPYASHGLQLNAYRWMWLPVFPNIDKLRLVYFDMAGVVQIKVPLMPLEEVEARLADGAEAYFNCIENDSIPDGQPNNTRWECRYCDVKDICAELAGITEEVNGNHNGCTVDIGSKLSKPKNSRKKACKV